MTTVTVYHEIDDQAAWLAAPSRAQVYGPLGITVRTFIDPRNPNRAAVLVDTPDMETFQNAIASPEAAAAMANDGVRAATVVAPVEA